jgi:hypothetical protein
MQETEPSRPPDSGVLSLGGAVQATRGGESEIYLRPGKPSQLVKVLRPNVVARFERSRRLKTHLRRRLRVGPYKNFLRFYTSYLDAMLAAQEIGRSPPLPHPRALVVTDRGLGLVVQMIRDTDGGLATSLRDIHESGGLDDGLLAKLNEFVGDVYLFNIVCTDLVPQNIVYETRHGRDRFVLIDGFGSRNIIPFRRWSRRLNARALNESFAELARRLELRWNPDTRRLSNNRPGRLRSDPPPQITEESGDSPFNPTAGYGRDRATEAARGSDGA